MGTIKERGGEGMIWGGGKVVVWMRVREEFGSRVVVERKAESFVGEGKIHDGE